MTNKIQISSIRKLRDYFFEENTNYPFPSSEIFQMLGYSRHSTFKRFLNQDRFNDDYIIKPWVKIESRKGDVYFLSRLLFLKVITEKQFFINEIQGFYLEFQALRFKKIENGFVNNKTKTYAHHLDCWEKVKGKIYTHRLNTISLARAIGVCEYEVFEFCAKNLATTHGFSSAGCTNSYGFRSEKVIPYISFDSIQHEKRYLYLLFIQDVINNFNMTLLKKELAKIYYNSIKRLLEKQYEYDCKEGRVKANFNNTTPVYSLSEEDNQRLKKMYRQASLLCHPDKNIEGEAIFIELNNAYQKNDIFKVEQILNNLNSN